MRRLSILVFLLAFACAPTEQLSLAPIYGHVSLRGVSDFSGTEVILSYQNQRLLTDKFGYFAFAKVPPGTHYVTAHRDGSLERIVAVKVEHDGVFAKALNFSLTPVGRIVGTVSDGENTAIVGATLRLAGSDQSVLSSAGGYFVLDPAPAGIRSLIAQASNYDVKAVEIDVALGIETEISIQLQRRVGHDPYAGNTAPVLSAIQISAVADTSYPHPIPVVNSGQSGKVRRQSRYNLSVNASDADADELNIVWSADRGTLLHAVGSNVEWLAGDGQSTLVCTVFDPFGASQTSRLIVQAAQDSIRGAVVYNHGVYYSERRDASFDVFRYDLDNGAESSVLPDPLQNHAVGRFGDWLVFGSTEFAFVSPLLFRLTALNLQNGSQRVFGQNFDHDSSIVFTLDLYTPLASGFVPYLSRDAGVAPFGFGFYDIAAQTALSPFAGVSPAPLSINSIAYDNGTAVWLAADGALWKKSGSAAATFVKQLNTTVLRDIQLAGDRLAYSLSADSPLNVLSLANPVTIQELGYAVPSFALHGHRVAYLEQGPVNSELHLWDLNAQNGRIVQAPPAYARRIWYLDDDFLLWGDQGASGQTFVELDTELLWVEQVH